MESPRTPIEFHFQPYDSGEGVFAVEKAEGGIKRRYLYGVSSGLKADGTGERMTEKAIQGFHNQANSGDVLLYSGKHGVDFSDDIGKMVESRILPNGDWMTGYRLYDSLDQLPAGGAFTLEKAGKVWAQLNGMTPYSKPRKKGFSVEGYIPPNGIVNADSMGRRVMDDVQLDGVVLVTRPAYQDSVARAVRKALGLAMPGEGAIDKGLQELVEDLRAEGNYHEQRLALDQVLDEQIRRVVNKDIRGQDRAAMLRAVLAEYGDLMTDLVMKSESVFLGDSALGSSEQEQARDAYRNAIKQLEAADGSLRVMKSLLAGQNLRTE